MLERVIHVSEKKHCTGVVIDGMKHFKDTFVAVYFLNCCALYATLWTKCFIAFSGCHPHPWGPNWVLPGRYSTFDG